MKILFLIILGCYAIAGADEVLESGQEVADSKIEKTKVSVEKTLKLISQLSANKKKQTAEENSKSYWFFTRRGIYCRRDL